MAGAGREDDGVHVRRGSQDIATTAGARVTAGAAASDAATAFHWVGCAVAVNAAQGRPSQGLFLAPAIFKGYDREAGPTKKPEPLI